MFYQNCIYGTIKGRILGMRESIQYFRARIDVLERLLSCLFLLQEIKRRVQNGRRPRDDNVRIQTNWLLLESSEGLQKSRKSIQATTVIGVAS